MVVSPTFVIDTDQVDALKRLIAGFEQEARLTEPMKMYIAGGMAVHLYTGYRTTVDVDAEFSRRVLIPQTLFVDTKDGGVLYLDPNYNSMFALMHEDYLNDAIKAPVGTELVEVYVLNPVDLIISKIARFTDMDKDDIRALIERLSVLADAIEKRVIEALSGYVGNSDYLKMNLKDVLEMARKSGPLPDPDGEPSPSSPRPFR